MPKLQIKILEDKQSLGRTTAEHAARSLRAAIRDRGLARIIAGASQFEFLEGDMCYGRDATGCIDLTQAMGVIKAISV